METKFSTSFIPKTNIQPVGQAPKRPLGLFAFLSTVIFFISAVVAVGAFGWHKYLDGSKAQMQSDLEKNIKAFEPQTIDQYVRLDNRINSAKELLAKHVAVSYIFDFLQDNTLQSVGFSDFSYSIGTNGVATLAMNGVARSYNAVAYQSTVFGNERALKDPIFSNLDLDNAGDVIFNFSTNIDPGFIAYARKAPQGASSPSDVVPISSGVQTFGQAVLPIATSTSSVSATASSTSNTGTVKSSSSSKTTKTKSQ